MGVLIAFLREVSRTAKTAIMLIPQRGGSERILAEIDGAVRGSGLRAVLILDSGLKVARRSNLTTGQQGAGPCTCSRRKRENSAR